MKSDGNCIQFWFNLQVNVTAEEVMIKRGEPGDYLFVIESGKLDCLIEVTAIERVLFSQSAASEIITAASVRSGLLYILQAARHRAFA
eukprot:656576-Amphidinium_carterae.1